MVGRIGRTPVGVEYRGLAGVVHACESKCMGVGVGLWRSEDYRNPSRDGFQGIK